MVDSPLEEAAPALEVNGIWKSFTRDRPVLSDIHLSIPRGEIHALAGANGSGKSTLVKILAGFYQPDEGTISVGGVELPTGFRAKDARTAGLRFVHQDKMFIAGMSVLDNMCLGRDYATGLGRRIRWERERREITEEIERHNVHVSLSMDAVRLSAADKAKLAIIRALHTREGEHRRVIVLDEATAAMAGDEAAAIADWLRDLVAVEQLGVLFIGHRPDELRDVADRISVLRNSELVETFDADATTDEAIVEAIVGAPIASFYPPTTTSSEDRPARLRIDDLGGVVVEDMSFELRPGEIVGITGIEGSGFEEVPYLIFDPTRNGRGTITLDNRTEAVNSGSIGRRIDEGVVLVPAERAKFGLVGALTVRENVTQPRLPELRRRGFQSARLERDAAGDIIDAFSVKTPSSETRVGLLSGGNQQKVLLGKWAATSPEVFLLHEPTEGIDVLAKRDIFEMLGGQKRRGAAILIASIEYEDLANVCDRILVCGNGRIYTELQGDQVDGGDVMRAAYAASIAGVSEEAQRKSRWVR